MKRTATAQRREIASKMKRLNKEMARFQQMAKGTFEIEKMMRSSITTMPEAIKALPAFESLRSALFSLKDLVWTMNRNIRALEKRGKGVSKEVEKPFDLKKVNKELTAQLKIVARLERDAELFIKKNEALMREIGPLTR